MQRQIPEAESRRREERPCDRDDDSARPIGATGECRSQLVDRVIDGHEAPIREIAASLLRPGLPDMGVSPHPVMRENLGNLK